MIPFRRGQIPSKLHHLLPVFFVSIWHAGRRQNKLHTAAPDTELVEQPSDQQGHFASGRTAVHVRFIDDKVQSVALFPDSIVFRVSFKPTFRVVPDFLFSRTQQHIFQHGIICNQNVRTACLHFKARDQLRVLWIRPMLAVVNPFQKSAQILFRRNLPVRFQFFEINAFFPIFRVDHFSKCPLKVMILLCAWIISRIRRPPGVHAELRAAYFSSANASKRLNKLFLRIADQFSEATDLIGYQRIHRVHDHHSHAPLMPRFVFPRFRSQFCQKRPHEALGFPGARSCRNEQIFSSKGLFERVDLMLKG